MKLRGVRWNLAGAACLCLAAASVYGGMVLDVHRSAVVDQEGHVLKLRNDAIVRILGMDAPHSGVSSSSCVLFKDGVRWQIWVENEGLFTCDLEERPTTTAVDGVLGRIEHMAFNGEVILLDDGSIYEVENRDTFHTGTWRNDSKVLVIEDDRLVNLEEARGMVKVHKLREAP